jgi:hypothetical protein
LTGVVSLFSLIFPASFIEKMKRQAEKNKPNSLKVNAKICISASRKSSAVTFYTIGHFLPVLSCLAWESLKVFLQDAVPENEA